MSWIREDNQSFVYRFCNNVLRAGNIPCHVAFIMDGNRRFARKRNYAHAQGHLLGFDKLSQVCLCTLSMVHLNLVRRVEKVKVKVSVFI